MNYIRENQIKIAKPFWVKYLALFISICYLANPLQSPISMIFHEISHFLEAPNAIVEHSPVADHEYMAHQDHEHILNDNRHEHEFIDFLSSIFSTSDESDKKESIVTDIKFDKHLTTDEYLLKKTYSIEKKVDFVSSENNSTKGHSRALEEPPQSFSL